MKRSAMAMVILAGLFFMTVDPSASAATLKCMGADGRTACSVQQVAALNQGIATGRRMHKPLLADVKGVTQGANGSLECTQMNGSACTDQQLDAVVGLAQSTHSSAGTFHIVKEIDKSSPL
jgi:hypothetical protein